MKSPFRVKVGLVRLFWRFKSPESGGFAIDKYSGKPLLVDLADSKQTNFVVDLRGVQVLQIDAARYVAQIAPLVVKSIPVNVVNLAFRPFAGHVKPREAMCPVPLSDDVHNAIPVSVHAPDLTGSVLSSGSYFLSREYSGFRVVMKKFAQALRGKIGLSHDAPRKLIGQRPACVSSTCGLRYFNL